MLAINKKRAHYLLVYINAFINLVHAADPDEGINGEVRYMMESKDNAFSVDLYTGWVTTVSKLDREITPLYTLVLIAVDNGFPKQTATSQLHIRLVDYNDSPPVFTQETYIASGIFIKYI